MAEAITLETGDKSPLFDALDSKGERHNLTAVSYTHLTLPTILLV